MQSPRVIEQSLRRLRSFHTSCRRLCAECFDVAGNRGLMSWPGVGLRSFRTLWGGTQVEVGVFENRGP